MGNTPNYVSIKVFMQHNLLSLSQGALSLHYISAQFSFQKWQKTTIFYIESIIHYLSFHHFYLLAYDFWILGESGLRVQMDQRRKCNIKD